MGKAQRLTGKIAPTKPDSILTVIEGMEVAGLHHAPAVPFPTYHAYIEDVCRGQ